MFKMRIWIINMILDDFRFGAATHASPCFTSVASRSGFGKDHSKGPISKMLKTNLCHGVARNAGINTLHLSAPHATSASVKRSKTLRSIHGLFLIHADKFVDVI
jgi:hypothetical protein